MASRFLGTTWASEDKLIPFQIRLEIWKYLLRAPYVMSIKTRSICMTPFEPHNLIKPIQTRVRSNKFRCPQHFGTVQTYQKLLLTCRLFLNDLHSKPILYEVPALPSGLHWQCSELTSQGQQIHLRFSRDLHYLYGSHHTQQTNSHPARCAQTTS